MSERPTDFAPPPDSGGRMGIGAVLASLAHALLVLALAWGVNWTSHTPEGVEAELWSAVPQVAAPRAAEPQPVTPPPEPAKPTPPPPKPKPEAPPPPNEQEIRNAQIALEKAKREEQ
ncbi:MAG: protein TolA, partial [Pseudomonadota bacterium]